MIQNYFSLSTAVVFDNNENGGMITSVAQAKADDGTESVYIGFNNVTEEEIGNFKDKAPEVALFFSETRDIDLLIDQLKAAKKLLVEKDAPKGHVFHVPLDKIIIESGFSKTRPDPQKLVGCCSEYLKTGKWDREIIVDKNLVLKDGYVMYLVAKNLRLEQIPVRTMEGISILIGDTGFIFTDDKIYLNAWIENGIYYLDIKCGGKGRLLKLLSVEQAVQLLEKISSVFFADYAIEKRSQVNDSLVHFMIQRNLSIRPLMNGEGDSENAE